MEEVLHKTGGYMLRRRRCRIMMCLLLMTMMCLLLMTKIAGT